VCRRELYVGARRCGDGHTEVNARRAQRKTKKRPNWRLQQACCGIFAPIRKGWRRVPHCSSPTRVADTHWRGRRVPLVRVVAYCRQCSRETRPHERRGAFFGTHVARSGVFFTRRRLHPCVQSTAGLPKHTFELSRRMACQICTDCLCAACWVRRTPPPNFSFSLLRAIFQLVVEYQGGCRRNGTNKRDKKQKNPTVTDISWDDCHGHLSRTFRQRSRDNPILCYNNNMMSRPAMR